MVLIPTKVEQTLQEVILPDLEKGRKGFDLPHTQAVVSWMKELIQTIPLPKVDSQVMITAAYAHDWGYIGLFDGFDSNDPQIIKERKPLHMQRGAELIRHLLQSRLSSAFTTQQIEKTAQLVRVHDLVEEVKTEEEVLIMEADTLGMLDANRVKPTFTKTANDSFMEKEIYGRRFHYFIHEQARKTGEKLALDRIAFYA
jgi:hypothetical protein